MQALGMIETKGLLAAIESADAMLKAAEVSLVDKAVVGGGLITITVTGGVAAVKASVEAGAAAVEKLCPALLVSKHVIPRPSEELDLLFAKALLEESLKDESESVNENKSEALVETEKIEEKKIPEKSPKDEVDSLVKKKGLEIGMKHLAEMKVVALRNLARTYGDLGIAGRLISKAGKEELLAELRKHYEKGLA